MKKILYLMTMVLSAIMISCGKKANEPEINNESKEEQSKKVLECNPSSLTFPYEGGKKNIELTASGKWKTARWPSTIFAITPEEGDSGKTTIEIHCPRGGVMKDSIIFEMDGKRCTLPVKRSYTPGFSVSATKKVDFAPGNLQYCAATNSWRFAPNQLDVIGKDNENIAPDYGGWIDLFGWGTGAQPTLYTDDYSLYANYSDFFANTVLYNGQETWGYYMLFKEEWYYLLHERKDAEKKVMTAVVDGIFGLMLLPEDWRLPYGSVVETDDDQMKWFEDLETDPVKFGYNMVINVMWTQRNILTLEQWKKLEDAGAVFLPACGSRMGTTFTGTYKDLTDRNIYQYGEYQTRERYGKSGYMLSIRRDRIAFGEGGALCTGRAVRGAKIVK